MNFGGAFVLVSLITGIFLAWYFYLQARHKERITLMEKGADASNFYAQKPPKRNWSFPWLKLGLVFAGLSLGLALAMVLISLPGLKDQLEDVAPGIGFASTIFFGGVAMILAHFVSKNKEVQA